MARSEEELMELNEDLNDSNNFPERDGIVLPEDLYSAWENPDLAEIDLMTGTNKDELRYWIRELGHDVPICPELSVYKFQMPIAYDNVYKKMSTEERELADRFMQMQSGEKIWKITEFYNELLFRVPALEQMARHRGKNYNYYWTMPGANETLGSCHAVELAYVFGNPQAGLYTGGLYDEKLADTTQNMWVNFARTGDPGTEGYPWEPYTSENRKTMVLGREMIGMTTDLMQDQQEIIKPLLHLLFSIILYFIHLTILQDFIIFNDESGQFSAIYTAGVDGNVLAAVEPKRLMTVFNIHGWGMAKDDRFLVGYRITVKIFPCPQQCFMGLKFQRFFLIHSCVYIDEVFILII